MRNTLLGLHFLFTAAWLGCVIAIALCERVLLAGDRKAHLTLSILHMRVDKLVEVPLILSALVTGLLLWLQARPSGVSFYIMAGAGLVAMGMNLHCVGIVFKRHRAALADNWSEFDRLDSQQHKWGAWVLIGMLAAFLAGVWGRTLG